MVNAADVRTHVMTHDEIGMEKKESAMAREASDRDNTLGVVII